MDAQGKVEAGDYVRLLNGWICYVECVTASGAHLVPLNDFKARITTRKRVTKVVKRHKKPFVVSASCGAELIDPSKLDLRRARRIIAMGKIEGAVQETAGAAAEAATPAAQVPRVTQKYLRTSKEAKEMKGQGKIVLDALNSADGPMNVEELTAQLKGKFTTRQDEARVVGFYLSKFKRDGLVNVAKSDGSPANEPVNAAV
jgi:hypothetical protein